MKQLKIELELHVTGDGRTFLNFWNYMTGDDVTAQVIDGKLHLENEDETTKVIELNEFIDMVTSKFKEDEE